MRYLFSILRIELDAIETFTPPGMGGDSDLAKARKKIPQNICMIGGFDQYHFFKGCTPQQTRAEVRRCFEAAGKNGAYILCPIPLPIVKTKKQARTFARACLIFKHFNLN
jgi:uroporphyrinogen decarboxylase